MSQSNEKNHKDDNKKPIFLRGLKPSTKKWIDQQINEDEPTRPAVVRRIVEEEKRRQVGDQPRRKR